MNLKQLATVTVPQALFRRSKLVTNDGYQLTANDKLEMMELTRLFEWAFSQPKQRRTDEAVD